MHVPAMPTPTYEGMQMSMGIMPSQASMVSTFTRMVLTVLLVHRFGD